MKGPFLVLCGEVLLCWLTVRLDLVKMSLPGTAGWGLVHPDSTRGAVSTIFVGYGEDGVILLSLP